MPSAAIQFLLAVCLGSLSWKKRWCVKCLLMYGPASPLIMAFSKKILSIIPSNIIMGPGPHRLMAAHTWTFDACFGLGFETACPGFVKLSLAKWSKDTLVSSVKSTSFHSSFYSIHWRACLNRNSLFCSLIIGVNLAMPYFHPSRLRTFLIEDRLTSTPRSVLSLSRPCLATNSSFSFVNLSISSTTTLQGERERNLIILKTQIT